MPSTRTLASRVRSRLPTRPENSRSPRARRCASASYGRPRRGRRHPARLRAGTCFTADGRGLPSSNCGDTRWTPGRVFRYSSASSSSRRRARTFILGWFRNRDDGERADGLLRRRAPVVTQRPAIEGCDAATCRRAAALAATYLEPTRRLWPGERQILEGSEPSVGPRTASSRDPLETGGSAPSAVPAPRRVLPPRFRGSRRVWVETADGVMIAAVTRAASMSRAAGASRASRGSRGRRAGRRRPPRRGSRRGSRAARTGSCEALTSWLRAAAGSPG